MRKIKSIIVVLLLFFGVAAQAQTNTVKGTVADDKGNPISFATITEQGTKNATTANADGSFMIKVKSSSKLTITAVGYSPITMNATDNLKVILKSSEASTLNEVVVTALGIRRNEKAIGYSISKVDPNTVLQKSEPDLLKGLQGKVPGVDIRTSQGTPGSATRIQIRGNSSFGLETQPLIVVDGVPYSNTQLTTAGQNMSSAGGAYGSGLGDLDPNDIESFNILKGAAAASLYGSRASRGVVVITTKSGSGKKGAKPLNISFKSSISAEKIANLPEFQNSYGTGAQNRVGGGSNGSWGGLFGSGNVYDASGNVVRSSASGIDSVPAWGSMLTAYPELFDVNGRTGYKAYPNNVKDLFNTGMLYENSIGVNGGDANTTFGVTVSNVNHLGYVENSSYVKNSISVGGQTRYKNLTIGGNLSYTKSKQKGGFFGIAQGFITQFGRTLIMGRSWDIAGFPQVDKFGNPLAFIAGQYTPPSWGAYHNVITTNDERVVANFRASYKISNAVSLNYNIGANQSGIFRDEIVDEFSGGPDATYAVGRIVEDQLRQLEIQSTLVAVFTPKIGKEWSLDFKIGNDFNQRTSRRQAQRGVDFIVPGIFSLTNTVDKAFLGDERNKRRLVGTFADVTLGFKNFAFVNATGRNDRTSTLPYANASYFYSGISGSLVWTDAFKLKSNWLDYGKIRVGYAKVGNDADPQKGEDLFGLSNTTFTNQPYASRDITVIDPKLTPEFTKELEIGTDLSLFKRRINLDFTWYNKISTNLIYPITVPATVGYTKFYTNIGQISNKGVEIGLTVRPVVTKNFTWEIRGAFTKNKNYVDKLVEGLQRDILGYISYIEAGYPYGYLRGDAAARTPDGQLLIEGSTGYPVITPNTQMIGDPNPDWKLGITNSLSYKGVSLSALWDMTKGGDFFSETITSYLGRGVTRDTEDRLTGWVIGGVYADPATIGTPNPTALLVGGKPVRNQTRVSTNDLFFAAPPPNSSSFAINGLDEFNVFDGTVYRLREITLGYDLPKNFVRRLKVVSAINISASGRNLWYLAPNVPKYTNYDPESNSLGNGVLQGVELSAAPTTKRFGFNINVTF